ncbi:helix-turn-helix domain-containing protein [Nonomuraea angiospora]|uniref:Transcriptional regulator with XRE-family HTH domain/tetratricopeptide (TPR) repeat protein n=1 Tax=Nonomuraea angiospora TaxID=46172 RepID=A0ABR9MF40_9ACTN|nr:helix-turn-helix transcriptional regulator [Nonomuraea angiospora]MBE1590966.1 transcriptional regulator with XRE-family HTH domain/tetratricopeptide (TPR) repeat protein [Nonomuraea angiospora]
MQATGQRIEATVRFGEALRKSRERQKVSLNTLHELTFFSKSYLSRVERGERNPERVLAELVDEALGANGRLIRAWDSDYASNRTIVGSSGGEATKRREFITSAALLAGGAFDDLAGQPEPSTAAVARLRDALIPTTPTSQAASPAASLSRSLIRAQRDFAAARYLPLADELAALLPVASAVSTPADMATAARIYHLTTRTLIKLSASPYAWISAHKGVEVAQASSDLQAIGECRRDLISLFHRAAEYRKARDVAISAAESLRPQLADATPHAWGAYGALLSTGAIAAARLEDRHSALDMLTEADEAAHHAPNLTLGYGHVPIYKMGVSIVLGDAGTAIEHAKAVIPNQIPTLERRGSYYTGIAEAYALWGKTDRAIRALLIAEKIAPSEVRRSGTRQVITELLRRDPHSKLSGLRGLARRVGVTL